jgi:hypothetical protein
MEMHRPAFGEYHGQYRRYERGGHSDPADYESEFRPGVAEQLLLSVLWSTRRLCHSCHAASPCSAFADRPVITPSMECLTVLDVTVSILITCHLGRSEGSLHSKILRRRTPQNDKHLLLSLVCLPRRRLMPQHGNLPRQTAGRLCCSRVPALYLRRPGRLR